MSDSDVNYEKNPNIYLNELTSLRYCLYITGLILIYFGISKCIHLNNEFKRNKEMTSLSLKIPSILVLIFYVLSGIWYIIGIYNYSQKNDTYILSLTFMVLSYLFSKLFIYTLFSLNLFSIFKYAPGKLKLNKSLRIIIILLLFSFGILIIFWGILLILRNYIFKNEKTFKKLFLMVLLSVFINDFIVSILIIYTISKKFLSLIINRRRTSLVSPFSVENPSNPIVWLY